MNVKGTAKYIWFQTKKHTPEILMGVGTVAFAATCFFVGKGAIKAKDIVQASKEDEEAINKLHDVLTDAAAYSVVDNQVIDELSDKYNLDEKVVQNYINSDYTDKDYRTDLAKQRIKTGVDLLRTFAPAIGLGVLTLGCFTGSYKILNKRNLSLASAYAALDKGYQETKGRLISEFGPDKAMEILNGIHEEEVEETVVQKNGKEKTTVKMIKRTEGPDHISPYACWFEAEDSNGNRNPEWLRDPVLRENKTRVIQNQLNDLLRVNKHLFLREAYDWFGVRQTCVSQRAGWIIDPSNPNTDDYVKVTIFKGIADDDSWILDFNCDGNILDKLTDSDF